MTYMVRKGVAKRTFPPAYKMGTDDGVEVLCGPERPLSMTCPDCKQGVLSSSAKAGLLPDHLVCPEHLICPMCGSHWESCEPHENVIQWLLRRARFYW